MNRSFPPRQPVHTYNNGQPYRIARGRAADRASVESAIRKGHSILSGRPDAVYFLATVRRELKIRKYSANSISNYLSALGGFLAWFGSPPNRITREDVRDYLELLVDGGADASHLSVVLAAICTAFDKFCCRDITLGIATPRRKKRQPVVLSPQEVRRMLNAAPTRQSKIALGLIYAAGLRRCRLAIGSLFVALATVPMVFLLARIGPHFAFAFVFTLGAANAFIWCPALAYLGVRTHSRIELLCGLFGMATGAFWFWWMIYR